MTIDPRAARRQLLRFLLQSPLLCGAAAELASYSARAQERPGQDDAVLSGALKWTELIKSPDEALNVWDFEPVMRNAVPVGHYAYMAQGSDDFGTIRANRRGFDKIQLRPRRLVDTTHVDMSVEIFGQRYASPIFLCPVGALQMFHPEGEVAAARAAKTKNALQAVSTVANYSVEDVAAARGAPGWFQLYATDNWDATLGMIKRAERAGCTALALTVDIPARNLEPSARFFNRANDPRCQGCHTAGSSPWSLRHMFDGVDMTKTQMGSAFLTWDYVNKLKSSTSMKVLVKGIVTGDDAKLAIEHGADGVIVSNHGGRSDESLRGTIESLPEVVAAVRGRVPVLVDSGFRRGTDVFKALALGAHAVGIGRPYLWGLGAFGQAGVEKVLDLLNRELRIVMQQMGATSLAAISRSSLQL
ncbi:MAG TPA: alpha-hydroxy acid oxidase [Gammaproteobacteria bacterium]|nr:alpha-hydroxy acid oxidase [Gammaproteobacteria bacterium]